MNWPTNSVQIKAMEIGDRHDYAKVYEALINPMIEKKPSLSMLKIGNGIHAIQEPRFECGVLFFLRLRFMGSM